MLNKNNVVKVEVHNADDKIIIATDNIEFAKDFFSFSKGEFIILKGNVKINASKDEKVYIIFYYRNGSRVRYKTVIDLATDYQVNLHIGSIYEVLEERRKSYKIKTDLPAELILVEKDDEKEIIEQRKQALITDINVGGVFIVTELKFKVGDIVTISIFDKSFQCSINILRVQKIEDKRKNGYGCSFRDLSKQQEAIISKYIISCQVEEREKLKRMGY